MKPVYKADDGSEHPTAKAAEKHNAVVWAANEFRTAAEAYERAIGERILTADGEHFDMRHCCSYWRVRDRWGEMPDVVEIRVYPHGMSIDNQNGKPVVRWFEHDNNGNRSQYTTFVISELYADKRNAEAARLQMLQSTLSHLEVLVRKEEKRFKGKRDD